MQSDHLIYNNKVDILSINELELNNFRNYQNFALALTAKPVIITGNNGIGKTNILEAISLLAPGRGLRNAKLEELNNNIVQHNWNIQFVLNSSYGEISIKIHNSLKSDDNYERKIIKINDQLSKNHKELSKIFSMIWLTPQMDSLFILSSSDRRKFMDRLVYNFDTEHASRINNYDTAMRARIKLLKQQSNNDNWLRALEQSMAELAVAIATARIQTIEYIQMMINESETLFPKAQLLIKGKIENKINFNSSLQIEEEYKKELYNYRKIDFLSNRTNAGIHRSDLLVYHKNKNIAASLCSTGEQKALLLSIILAEAKARIKWRSSVPILLLDEVVAHLDEYRKEALFNELLLMKTQCWLTGTEVKVFKGLRNQAQFFEL